MKKLKLDSNPFFLFILYILNICYFTVFSSCIAACCDHGCCNSTSLGASTTKPTKISTIASTIITTTSTIATSLITTSHESTTTPHFKSISRKIFYLFTLTNITNNISIPTFIHSLTTQAKSNIHNSSLSYVSIYPKISYTNNSYANKSIATNITQPYETNFSLSYFTIYPKRSDNNKSTIITQSSKFTTSYYDLNNSTINLFTTVSNNITFLSTYIIGANLTNNFIFFNSTNMFNASYKENRSLFSNYSVCLKVNLKTVYINILFMIIYIFS